MILEVGLNIMSLKIEHIVSIVPCSRKRRMHDIMHLLVRVGMVIIGKSSSSCMLVDHLYCNEEVS